MLFVGNQKHSALSIFAKTTRMSALVLCGNSGVILLSVKDHQHIDSAIPGRYTVQAPYKAGVGIGVLELHTATIGALASFLLLQLSYTQIMVGAGFRMRRLRQPCSVHHQRNWRFRWWKLSIAYGGCHHGYDPNPHST
jgi:hypothetical protein